MPSSVYTLPCPLLLREGDLPLAALLTTRRILEDGSARPTPEYLERLSILFTAALRVVVRPLLFPALLRAADTWVLPRRVLPEKVTLRERAMVDTLPADRLLPVREEKTAAPSVSSSSPRIDSRGRGELGRRASSGLISSRARARAFRRLRHVRAACLLVITKAKDAGPRAGCQPQFVGAVASARRGSRDILYSRSRARFVGKEPAPPSFIQALWRQCALWDVTLDMVWASSLAAATAEAVRCRHRGAK